MRACWWLLVPGRITLVFAFAQTLLYPYKSSGLAANGCLVLFLVVQARCLLVALRPRDMLDVVDSGSCGDDQSKGYCREQTDSLACTAVAVVDAAPCPADWKGPAVSDPTIQPSCFVSRRPLLNPS